MVFLNTWNAKVREALTEFIKEQSRDTDVFCFQEVYDDMKQLARDLLPAYVKMEKYKEVNKDDNFPQAIYVKNSIPIVSSGTIMEHDENIGLGLYVQLQWKNGDLYLCNFHGMSMPGDKLDNPDRIRQSKTLIGFFKDKPGLKIIGGDFNISPQTESITMFQKASYRDLIKDFNIATTRNRLAWEKYPDKKYYSDYVFVSPDVNVKSFSVLNIEISDHLPLIIEVE